MATSKKYTLTEKNSVKGSDYYHQKGDVIGEDDYKKLAKRHKEYFEEGAKTLQKETPTDQDQNERIDEIEARLDAIDAKTKFDSKKAAAEAAAEKDEDSARNGKKK